MSRQDEPNPALIDYLGWQEGITLPALDYLLCPARIFLSSESYNGWILTLFFFSEYMDLTLGQ